MNTYIFDDPDALTSAGREILLAAAYWMYRFKQARVTVYRKGMNLTITTDFTQANWNDGSATLFEATISENGQSEYVPYAVSIIEQLPPNFGRGWECSAMVHQLLASFNVSKN